MRTVANIVMMLVLVGTACGIGFYLGIKKGAEVMVTLSNQNEVYQTLGRIRLSGFILAVPWYDFEYGIFCLLDLSAGTACARLIDGGL